MVVLFGLDLQGPGLTCYDTDVIEVISSSGKVMSILEESTSLDRETDQNLET